MQLLRPRCKNTNYMIIIGFCLQLCYYTKVFRDIFYINQD